MFPPHFFCAGRVDQECLASWDCLTVRQLERRHMDNQNCVRCERVLEAGTEVPLCWDCAGPVRAWFETEEGTLEEYWAEIQAKVQRLKEEGVLEG